MAQIIKPPKDRRTRVFNIRLTLQEELELIQESQSLGFPNMSLYVRHILFRKSVSTQNFREKTIRFYTHFDQFSQIISRLTKEFSEQLNTLKTENIQTKTLTEIHDILADLADIEDSINEELKLLNKNRDAVQHS